MKKLLFLVFVLALFANLAFAQQQIARASSSSSATKNPTTKKSAAKAKQTSSTTRSKGEVYVGYSGNAAQRNTGSGFVGDRQVHHGVQTSVTVNANRFVGLKGDFSITYRDQAQNFVTGSLTRRTTIMNILGGVQIKDNESEAVVQPFGHALVGAANYRQRFREQNCDNVSSVACNSLIRKWGLAGAFGGGFDVKVANRAGVRFNGDYNPIRIEGQTINNFRFGVGVVFK